MLEYLGYQIDELKKDGKRWFVISKDGVPVMSTRKVWYKGQRTTPAVPHRAQFAQMSSAKKYIRENLLRKEHSYV